MDMYVRKHTSDIRRTSENQTIVLVLGPSGILTVIKIWQSNYGVLIALNLYSF